MYRLVPEEGYLPSEEDIQLRRRQKRDMIYLPRYLLLHSWIELIKSILLGQLLDSHEVWFINVHSDESHMDRRFLINAANLDAK